MSLYYTCIKKIDENKVIILPEANDLLKRFIQEKPEYYLNNFIRPFQIQSNIKTRDPFVTQIFGNYENFEEFLNNCNNYDDIQTIKTFFNKFKKNNYKPIPLGNEVL